MVVLEDRRIKLVNSESELLSLPEGYQTKVRLPERDSKWMVYEGRFGNRFSFIEQKTNDEKNPHRILSHISYLKHFQFDDENGVIFNHLYYNIVIGESGEDYFKAQRMLKEADQWTEFEKVMIPKWVAKE